MFERLERMSNQLPPRLKAMLNLAITATLVLVAIPFLWNGLTERAWNDISMGAGLLLLGIFNLFT